MNFLRSRSEQLADYLRDCIQRGEITDPIPSMRAWSNQLNVSRTTLGQALLRLKRDGLIIIESTGMRLPNGTRASARKRPPATRVVHLVYFHRDYPEGHSFHWLPWLVPLSERLHLHGVHLTLERCTDARLRAITRQPGREGELYLLASLPAAHQRLFGQSSKASVILGHPAEDAHLPSVTVDQAGTIRHATQTLLRHQHTVLSLLAWDVSAPGIRFAADTFHAACAAWPHQPIRSQVVLMPRESDRLAEAALRFAGSVKERHGIVVVSPVPLGLIMTTLLTRGVSIPGQAEIMAVMTTPDLMHVWPRPAHYPFPTHRLVKVLTDLAMHYFETGALQPVQKKISVELAGPGDD